MTKRPPNIIDEYPSALASGPVRGRATQINPPNRFEPVSLHVLVEHLDEIAVEHPGGVQVPTRVYRDNARTVINPVDSQDLHFKWSLNPYRGCEHGCVYCYARPTHETFGLSCGLDFETRLFAKTDAPELLRRELARPGWKGEPIMMGGVTDCYQPVERSLKITRGCLEVMAGCRQPVSFVTKSSLVTRDIDVMKELAAHNALSVCLSVTTLDNRLARKMEPRAGAPRERLDAMKRLADAGVPVTVMVAPIIPTINDHEVPAILKAAGEHGATGAGYVMLRLPHQIKDLYLDWLRREFPDRAAHAENQLREMRGGALYDARWRVRQRGEGARARQIAQTFKLFKSKYRLDQRGVGLNAPRGAFVRPTVVRERGQMGLFG